MDIKMFHALAEKCFDDVIVFLDDYSDKHDVDIDYEVQGNVMTIEFENATKIIINTQEPLLQIWLASRKQGYHFEYKDQQWVCNRSNELFYKVLKEAVDDQVT